MSKRRQHARPCPTATKTPFRDRIAAESAIARIRAEDNPLRVKLPCRAYRCECGAWHMTSRERSEDDRGYRVAESEAKLETASAAMRRIASAAHG